jgi:hypothetical protein
VIGENPAGEPVEAFDNLLAKACALCYELNRGHGFTDGNKRTSLMSMVLMLWINGADMILPRAMTKYLLMVAEDRMTEKEFLNAIRRYAYSNRFVGVWKRYRYNKLPELVYQFYRRAPGLWYVHRMNIDWLGAGNEEALNRFWDEEEPWEERGYPKGDVELGIEGALPELVKRGLLTEE